MNLLFSPFLFRKEVPSDSRELLPPLLRCHGQWTTSQTPTPTHFLSHRPKNTSQINKYTWSQFLPPTYHIVQSKGILRRKGIHRSHELEPIGCSVCAWKGALWLHHPHKDVSWRKFQICVSHLIHVTHVLSIHPERLPPRKHHVRINASSRCKFPLGFCANVQLVNG